MTVAEAAKQWEAAKREMARQKALLEAAAPILVKHLKKTGKSYRGRIALAPGHQVRLDTQKVKEELGERLPDFQKPLDYEYLVLLKP